MHPSQLELWCAEPHRIPRIYSQLCPEQRTRLMLHLAFLMLKRVRPHPNPDRQLPTPPQPHER